MVLSLYGQNKRWGEALANEIVVLSIINRIHDDEAALWRGPWRSLSWRGKYLKRSMARLSRNRRGECKLATVRAFDSGRLRGAGDSRIADEMTLQNRLSSSRNVREKVC